MQRLLYVIAALLASTFVAVGAFGTETELVAGSRPVKFFLVIREDEAVASPDGTPRKKYKEPDVQKLGGTVLKRHDKTVVVELPAAAASRLCTDENVAYVQRIWEEGSRSSDLTDELCPRPKKSKVQSDTETNLTWSTGQYIYDGSGNIKKIGNDSFVYDKVGRLVTAVVGGKTETYKYDSFGNLTEKTVTGESAIVNPTDGSSNRLVGEAYDGAGAILTRNGAYQYYYDSVGMVTMIRPPFQTGRRMIYAVDDERIGELIGTNYSRWQMRDLQGHVLRDFKDDGMGFWLWNEDYVYADGKLVGGEREEYHGGVRQYHLDHLGSVRMVTNSDRMRYAIHDFYPFGVERTASLQEKDNFGTDRPGPMKFTGHERDFLGLTNVENTDYVDYMHARYYDPNRGRFLSVDPGKDWDLRLPQSWNMYAYAGNNPMKFVDDDGRSKVSFFVKTVKGIWREVEEKVAVRVARSAEKHAVRAEGPAASRRARRVAELANEGEEIVRHDPHLPGTEPHWQPRKRKGGHVGYTVLGALVTIGSFLPYVGDFVETDPIGETDANPYLQAAAKQIYGANYNELTPEEKAEIAKSVNQSDQDKKKREDDRNKDSFCYACPREIFGIPIP